MSDGDDLTLLKLLVEAAGREYAELSELWKQLDAKAQNTVSLAGILLAALVAFLTKGNSQPSLLDRWLMGSLAVGLFLAIISAVGALLVRSVSGPPHFGSLQTMLDDLLNNVTEEERGTRMTDFTREQIATWKPCIDDTRKALDSKVIFVSVSQWLILISACIIMAFVASKVIS